jgi:predicted amidophosphoribosyltransferase
MTFVQGRRLVLLDDVMTTGASLFEAARTLRAAGAAHITAMVLARTETRDHGHED